MKKRALIGIPHIGCSGRRNRTSTPDERRVRQAVAQKRTEIETRQVPAPKQTGSSCYLSRRQAARTPGSLYFPQLRTKGYRPFAEELSRLHTRRATVRTVLRYLRFRSCQSHRRPLLLHGRQAPWSVSVCRGSGACITKNASIPTSLPSRWLRQPTAKGVSTICAAWPTGMLR